MFVKPGSVEASASYRRPPRDEDAMPRGAATRAAAAPVAVKAPSKKYDVATRDVEAKDRAERRRIAREAAVWAFNNKVGSKAALNTAAFKDTGVTYNMAELLLNELKAGGQKQRMDAPRDHPKQVCTCWRRCCIYVEQAVEASQLAGLWLEVALLQALHRECASLARS